MAQQQNAVMQHKGPGRPAGVKGTPKETATRRLQAALDQAAKYINDGGSSYAARAARAAKHIPRETAEKGLVALQGALADARAAIERAYAPKQERAEVKRRITL